jgi:predicted membrane protein
VDKLVLEALPQLMQAYRALVQVWAPLEVVARIVVVVALLGLLLSLLPQPGAVLGASLRSRQCQWQTRSPPPMQLPVFLRLPPLCHLRNNYQLLARVLVDGLVRRAWRQPPPPPPPSPQPSCLANWARWMSTPPLRLPSLFL